MDRRPHRHEHYLTGLRAGTYHTDATNYDTSFKPLPEVVGAFFGFVYASVELFYLKHAHRRALRARQKRGQLALLPAIIVGRAMVSYKQLDQTMPEDLFNYNFAATQALAVACRKKATTQDANRLLEALIAGYPGGAA